MLDCVHETAKDNLEIDEDQLPAATAADLERVAEMLDVLGGDLAGLTEQVAALEGLPEAATKILDVALKTDERCRAALHKLDALAQGFDALGKQNANAGEFRSALEKPAAPPTPAKPQRKAGELYTNSLGMKFAWIPPGTFLMGSPPNEPDRLQYETQHTVTLTKGFWLGIHPVTQVQWQAVTDDNPSRFKGDHLPVEKISWDDALAFCQAMGRMDGVPYRLPTEAEWEYACRAGTSTPFHFGAAISTDLANYDPSGGKKGVSRWKSTPVGSFPPNAWGLYDMHGNVMEWCQDWHGGPYFPDDITNPQGAKSGEFGGGWRVLRGGDWTALPRFCRSANRFGMTPNIRSTMWGVGVRCAWTESAPPVNGGATRKSPVNRAAIVRQPCSRGFGL